MELPDDLKNAVELELSALSPKSLAKLAAGLSDRYRTDKPASGKSLIESQADVDTYAAFRLPATFAAAYAVFRQVQEGLPDWEPHSIFDAGAGPGTVLWAAAAAFSGLSDATLLERDEGMIALGQRLASHSSSTTIQQARWVKADLAGDWGASSYDLVTASYVLGELNEQHREAMIRKLWLATKGNLIIIEPGTPAGFARIRQARQQLVASGGLPIAPCPHNLPCPMTQDNWCHFSQRVSRSRLHKQIKAGELSYEDEKFSFIAVSREHGVAIPGRILRHPQVRKGHIAFEICSSDGVSTRIITRKDKELYRKARSLGWGSVLPPE